MKKYLTYIFAGLTMLSIVSCGNGKCSSQNNANNPQTFGGVNQPAASVYSVVEGAESRLGIMRLTSASNGMLMLYSYPQESQLNYIDVKGLVNNFNSNSNNCLSSNVTGFFNGTHGTYSLSLTNCNIVGNDITANLALSSNGTIVYTQNVTLINSEIINRPQLTTLVTNLASTEPQRYNVIMQVLGNLVFNVNNTANNTYTPFFAGALYGEFINQLATPGNHAFNISGVSGNINVTVIDSTSLNINFTNLQFNSYISYLSGSSLSCNVISDNLTINGQLNPIPNLMVTGCNGNINAQGAGNVSDITGNVFNYVAG